MIQSDSCKEYAGYDMTDLPLQWKGRQLTEGQRINMPMVPGRPPVEARHGEEMVGVVRFAGDVAHHFNNVLSAVTGYANILKAKIPAGDPALSYVEEMLASSQMAHELVRSLYIFAGNDKVVLRETDLNNLVKRAVRFFSLAPANGVEVNVELFDNDLIVMADVDRMEEIFIHLLANGMDAMPGGGTVTLRTAVIQAGEGSFSGLAAPSYASFSVSDTGVGMDEETKRRIFDPFFTKKGPGRYLGLGLSKAYGVVKQHSGEIAVESAPGKGTTLTVCLPLLRSTIASIGPIPLPCSGMAEELNFRGSGMGAGPWR